MIFAHRAFKLRKEAHVSLDDFRDRHALVSTSAGAGADGLMVPPPARRRRSIPQKNTGELCHGRSAMQTSNTSSLDDGGDTTARCRTPRSSSARDHIDVLDRAVDDAERAGDPRHHRESKVPMLATVGTSSVVELIDAKRRWVFKTTQNDDLIASALITW
jgi:hypothetical protein